jgi:hypothetical protein
MIRIILSLLLIAPLLGCGVDGAPTPPKTGVSAATQNVAVTGVVKAGVSGGS